MAQIGHFDATNVAPAEDLAPFPVGEYTMQIVDSDVKPTKNNNGHYAELVFEVTEGECKGRKVWTRLNLDNPSPKAVEIAQRELSAICHAAGVLQVNDTQALHYKPMLVRVDIEQRDGYSPRNITKAYKALAGGAGNGQPATAATTSAPAATAASPSSPPWAQKAA